MKTEKLEKSHVKITFEVTPEEFEHCLEHAFAHVQKEVTVKGFRKGKVPRNIYEANYGVESLYEDALNHLFGHKYEDALESHDLVGQPKVVDFNVTMIERGKPFTFAFESAVKPTVKLGEYKGLEVKKENYKVTAKEVDSEIDKLLSSDNSVEPKPEGQKLENGDIAIFDFEGFKDGVPFEGGKAENYELEIGSGGFIPGFEEQMVGMGVTEEKELNVKFPDQYQSEELAGKDVIFKVKLHEIKTKIKAQLTDEWVAGLNKENITTVEELKKSVKSDLEKEKETKENDRVTDTVVELAAKNAKVDIPVEMIAAEVEQMRKNVQKQAEQYKIELDMFLQLCGTNRDDFEVQIGKAANKKILETLVLEEIAKTEKFTFTDAEIDAKYAEIALEYQMGIEDVKKYFPASTIQQELEFRKAIEFLKENSKRS